MADGAPGQGRPAAGGLADRLGRGDPQAVAVVGLEQGAPELRPYPFDAAAGGQGRGQPRTDGGDAGDRQQEQQVVRIRQVAEQGVVDRAGDPLLQPLRSPAAAAQARHDHRVEMGTGDRYLAAE